MTTKSIIGLIIVLVIIVLIGIWLHKAPASPAAPDAPSVTPISGTSSDNTAMPSDLSAPAPTSSPSSTSGQAPATNNNVITTKTIQGMKIDVTKTGSGPEITNGQTAEMLYTGKLADGSVFDSTDKHGGQPFAFTLGAGQVIKGWDLGIVGMKVGEKRTLTIPADLAYGAHGYPPVIPANATLTFDVTLVGIK